MAQPIQLHRIRRDAESEVRARLAAAPLQHADAILAAYALLQTLQDHGVLDLIRGLTGAGGEAFTKLAEAANTPEAIAAMRNIVSTMRILGSIDPQILHGIAEALARTDGSEIAAPGLWTIVRRLGSKESLRAIGAAAYGLQVFGRVLISRQLSKN
jgi:uncharacterized protein YjgD (DUF1641 family)